METFSTITRRGLNQKLTWNDLPIICVSEKESQLTQRLCKEEYKGEYREDSIGRSTYFQISLILESEMRQFFFFLKLS